MPSKLKWAGIKEVSTVDAGANLKGRFPITKGLKMDFKEKLEAALETPVAGEDEIKKTAENDEAAEALVAAYRLADALGVKDDLFKVAEAKEPEATPETPEQKPMNKDEGTEMNEEFQKSFDALQKRLDGAEQESKELRKSLDAAEDKAALNEWVQKAKENLQFLPGDFADQGAELHAVAKIDKALADKQFERLCGLAKQMEKSDSFKAIGTAGAKEAPALDRITKKADELVKDRKLSPLQAMRQAALDDEKNQ